MKLKKLEIIWFTLSCIGIGFSYFISYFINKYNQRSIEIEYTKDSSVIVNDLIQGFGRAVIPSAMSASMTYNNPIRRDFFQQTSQKCAITSSADVIVYIIRTPEENITRFNAELETLYDTQLSNSFVG